MPFTFFFFLLFHQDAVMKKHLYSCALEYICNPLNKFLKVISINTFSQLVLTGLIKTTLISQVGLYQSENHFGTTILFKYGSPWSSAFYDLASSKLFTFLKDMLQIREAGKVSSQYLSSQSQQSFFPKISTLLCSHQSLSL